MNDDERLVTGDANIADEDETPSICPSDESAIAIVISLSKFLFAKTLLWSKYRMQRD